MRPLLVDRAVRTVIGSGFLHKDENNVVNIRMFTVRLEAAAVHLFPQAGDGDAPANPTL